MWQDEASHLTLRLNKFGGEEKTKMREKEREKREERKRREKLKLLFMIYGDRLVGFCRAKN